MKRTETIYRDRLKVYIYGTGPSAMLYYKTIDKKWFQILGFLDSDPAKQGELFNGLSVCHIDSVLNNEYDEIHIASVHLEIVEFLLKRGIPSKKIVLANSTLELKYIAKYDLFGGIRMSGGYVLSAKMAYKNNLEVEKDFYWRDVLVGANSCVSYDYCRCKTVQLLSEEIYRNEVSGAVAELGVAQGDFAKLLNRLFPDRRLDLFDTFEGFDVHEKKYEVEQGYTNERFFDEVGDFKDMSAEKVLKKMSSPENCRVFKGKFPETVCGIDENQYALASIDCDLYIPILEGLKYFYPRLSEGGYIMLHDYNHMHFKGVKKAVRECEALFGRMHKVPISDWGGSLVISK